MHTHQRLETVWQLFNLFETLSNILFDRYHDYLVERHLDEETILYFENHTQDLISKHSKQPDNLPNHPK
jgi:hypothetical protein